MVALLSLSLVFSFISCIFVIAKEKIQLDLDKKRFKAPHFETIFSKSRLLHILLDCAIFLIHPYPFLVGLHATYYNQQISNDITYNINDFLQWFAMIRIIKVGARLINLTRWKSNSAQRICLMYGCEADTMFGVKSLMKRNPVSFLIGNLLVGAVFFSILVKYCESAVNKVEFDSHNNLNRMENCLWLVLVTMTTGSLVSCSRIRRRLSKNSFRSNHDVHMCDIRRGGRFSHGGGHTEHAGVHGFRIESICVHQ